MITSFCEDFILSQEESDRLAQIIWARFLEGAQPGDGSRFFIGHSIPMSDENKHESVLIAGLILSSKGMYMSFEGWMCGLGYGNLCQTRIYTANRKFRITMGDGWHPEVWENVNRAMISQGFSK